MNPFIKHFLIFFGVLIVPEIIMVAYFTLSTPKVVEDPTTLSLSQSFTFSFTELLIPLCVALVFALLVWGSNQYPRYRKGLRLLSYLLSALILIIILVVAFEVFNSGSASSLAGEMRLPILSYLFFYGLGIYLFLKTPARISSAQM